MMIDTREATEKDIELIYECRFHPDHVLMSLNKHIPSLDESRAYIIKNKMLSEYRIIVSEFSKAVDYDIGYLQTKPDGSVHISLLPTARGMGIGTRVLKQTTGWTYILDKNIGSIKAFEKAGYEKVGVLMKKVNK